MEQMGPPLTKTDAHSPAEASAKASAEAGAGAGAEVEAEAEAEAVVRLKEATVGEVGRILLLRSATAPAY